MRREEQRAARQEDGQSDQDPAEGVQLTLVHACDGEALRDAVDCNDEDVKRLPAQQDKGPGSLSEISARVNQEAELCEIESKDENHSSEQSDSPDEGCRVIAEPSAGSPPPDLMLFSDDR